MSSSSRNERLVNEWWDLVLYEPEKLPDVSEPPKPRPHQVVWFRRTDQGQIRAWRVHRLHGLHRPSGRAPRRACNLRVRSRRDAAGSRSPPSGDDDPHEDGEDDGDDHHLLGARVAL